MSLRPRYPFLFLVALVAAFSLWYAQAAQRRERISVRSVKAPLTLVNIPPNLMLASAVAEPITVQLRGPLSQSLDGRSPVEVLLDLSDARPGRSTYTIQDADVQHPSGLTVVSLDPREVELELEGLEVLSLPVRPVLEGAPAPGFAIGGVDVVPEQIRVRGPGSQLATLAEVQTLPVLVEGATGLIEATVQLDLPRPIRSLDPVQIMVLVEVVPESSIAPTPTPGRSR